MRKDWWDHANVIFTGLLVLIGIIGVWLALRSLKATETAANAAAKSAEVADRTLHLTQAADVHIVGVNLEPKALTMDTVVSVVVRNYGRTRAVNFTNNLILGIKGLPLGPTQPRSDIGVTLGARQPYNLVFDPLRNRLTTEGLAMVLGGQAVLQIWGSLRYRDVFGKAHIVDCEGTYNPKEGDFFIDHDEDRYENDAQ